MAGDSMKRIRRRRRAYGAVRYSHRQAGGIGNTAFAEANAAGRITWISLPKTWVFTGAAPWFWPLTNFVGP